LVIYMQILWADWSQVQLLPGVGFSGSEAMTGIVAHKAARATGEHRPVVIYPRPRVRPQAVMAVLCLSLFGVIGLIAIAVCS
jgi:hypothetical protein